MRIGLRSPASLVTAVIASAVTVAALAPSADGRAAGRATPRHPTQVAKLTAAQVQALSADATKHSIVIFKNQYANLPDAGRTQPSRVKAINSNQKPVVSELSQLHARGVKRFHIVNAVAATISAAEAARLAKNPAVQAVVPDRLHALPDETSAAAVSTASGSAASTGSGQLCPTDPKKPLLEPEALNVMHVEYADKSKPAAHDYVDGTGIKVGLIADGLDPNNPDLQRNGKSIVFDYRDFSGFGTNSPTDGREAFLDAGSIAAQGTQTYDLSGFVNPAHPLPKGCTIRIKGVAPGATIAALNLAGPNAGFFNSTIVQAVDWAVNHDHVDVLNESIGSDPEPNTLNDAVALADKAAVAAGVTVVASTGDEGTDNSIGSPASTPGVINAGGSTTYQVYRQTTRYDTQLVPGGWLNNNISGLSSGGTTEFGPRTVDVVAPGDRGWSLCSTNYTKFFGCRDIDHGTNPPAIWAAGGTSASAPLTSGTAALVIEAYAKTHHGARPSPQTVKQIIMSSATDLGAPAEHQGAGLVNALKAVQLAESINAKPAASLSLGHTLLVGKNTLVAARTVGQSASFTEKVTNEGSTTQTVSPSVVDLGSAITDNHGQVTLNNASPSLTDGEGNTDHYQIHKFHVGSGIDYLNGNIVWNAQAVPNANVEETLFDPNGNVAAYSLIGSDGTGRAHVEVRQPTPGTWTAVIFTVSTAPYTGTVKFDYYTQRFESSGTTSPSRLTLAPGKSGTFTVRTAHSNSPGDAAYTLRLHTTGSALPGSVPIVVRSLVAVGRTGGSFTGQLNGGLAPGNAGQRITYQFTLPAGAPSLDLSVALARANYGIEGFLTDPNGEPLDIQSTTLFDNAGNPTGFGRTMQFFRRTPRAGRWTISLLAAQPIDGAAQSVDFTGRIGFDRPSVSTTGLPNSKGTTVPGGKTTIAKVRITNTGNSAKDFFVDPRLSTKGTLSLLGSDVNNVALPLSLSAQPNWLVPPDSSQFTIGAQATKPIVLELSADFGDPDLVGYSSGNNAVATLTAPEVAPGPFFGIPELRGPFGAGPTTGSVNLGAIAVGNQFDGTMASSTGDFWAFAVDPNAEYAPLTLKPGQTGTIQVAIHPTAKAGTVVHGFLGVDTVNPSTVSGDELVNLPYTYTVG